MDKSEEQAEWWTFDMVREAMVDAVHLWRRSPGHGASPFATDGPWQLMTRENRAGDYDAAGGLDQKVDVVPRPLPLSCDEVATRDRVSEWLGLIAKPDDRKLVVAALGYLARGHAQVPWRRIKHEMRIPFGEHGLRKRFDRAIGAIAQSLNGAEFRR